MRCRGTSPELQQLPGAALVQTDERPRSVFAQALILAFLLALLAPPWHPSHAQTPDLAQFQEVREKFAKISGLESDLPNAREWERDGLHRRIDGLGLDALESLNRLTPALLIDSSTEIRQSLIEQLESAAAFALRRDRYLEQRTADERALIPKFQQSAEADIARAFMENLLSTRQQYLEALVEQLEARRAAGIDAEQLAEELRRRTLLILDVFTGQIRLDAVSLDELEARLRDYPLDENLQLARTLVQTKQSRSLDDLERILGAAESLGIPVAEQRSLLLSERREIGVELLQGEVFGHLWREQLTNVREDVLRHGPDLLFRLLLFTLLMLLTWLAARLVRPAVRALLYRERVRLSVLLRETLISTATVVVFVTGSLLAIAAIGVSVGPLLAGLGVLGIIFGLAIQDSLGNLAAGVMILIFRPYDIEDLVCVNGAEGVVKRMNLLATTIVTLDNQSVVIPNGRIWGDSIINHTARPVRRVDIEISATYREDPDRVISVLLDLVKDLDYVLHKPEPQAHVVDMADSAVTFMLKPWVRTEDFWTARWDLPRRIKKRFDAEGIEIPFPQRVVTLQQVPSASS